MPKPWKMNFDRPQDEPAERETDPVTRRYAEAEMDILAPEFDMHQEEYMGDADLAIRDLESFIERSHAQGKRRDDLIIRIIHGRGHGIFRQKVISLLMRMSKKKNGYVLDWRESTRVEEMGGVTYVRLAPNSR